jgi:hypothetical protein
MSKPKNAKQTARHALAVARSVQKTREVKFAITSLSLSADKAGHIIDLNNVPQGLGDSSRVGDRLQCKRLTMKLWRVSPGSASGRFSLRFLMIEDRMNMLTSVDQILMSADSAYAPFLCFVKDYRRNFRVLYDSGSNHMDQYNKGDCIERTKPLNVQTRFIAGTTQIAAGAVKLVVISNQASTSNNRPILIGQVRVDYTDS